MIAGPLTVVKVGGSLLGSAASLTEVAGAVARRRRAGERVLVVVSALRGVTDRLERAATEALDPRSGGEIVADAMQDLRQQHRAALRSVSDGESLWLRLQPVFDGVDRLLTGIRLTGELTPRTRDLVLAYGERLSAPLVAAAVREAGADARAVSSEEAGLRAVGPFRVGRCDLEASGRGLSRMGHELHDRVLVLTGFYGIDSGGDVVLFGRGGTDYTAGVAAAGLGADALEFWKNVPGFLSADPEAVPDACLVAELSFNEACELGYYGARILHPRCLEPLRGRGIAVSLRPVGDADVTGTRLVERRAVEDSRVAALATRRDVGVVRVRGATMVNEPGVAAAIFTALGDAGVRVDVLASALTSISFTLDAAHVPLALRTLRLMQEAGAPGVETIDVRRDAALVGVVGDGVSSDASLPALMLSRLAEAEVPVHLISHGPGDVSVSCAVPAADLDRAIAELHAAFFPEPTRALTRSDP